MGTNSTTQYSIHCDKCSEMDVLNQADPSSVEGKRVWTLKDAIKSWRFNGWKIGGRKSKCPNCSSNLKSKSVQIASEDKE